MTRLTFAAAVWSAALLSGCATRPPDIVPATGVVLLNGQPLPGAEVRFIPMVQGVGGEYIATAITDERGRFQLTCNGQPGACACENRVTVTDAPIPESVRGRQTDEVKFLAGLKNRPIPSEYGSVAKTSLVLTVAVGQAEYTLELKR